MREYLDAAVFKDMILCADAALAENTQQINELNVFPVPDGDTGTNMGLTMNEAAAQLRKKEFYAVDAVADCVAGALLRGARGNSGVILSLLFRGISRRLKGMETVGAKEFAAAMEDGVDAAYKAVMKPAEGTILTVARMASAAAVEYAKKGTDIEELLETALRIGSEALENTVNQNPVLQKAGVVDAGGKGYIVIFSAMLACLRGEVKAPTAAVQASVIANENNAFDMFGTDEITYAFDTVYIVRKNEPNVDLTPLRAYLSSIGDCLVIGEDDEAFKVHVHTNIPGEALTKSQQYGTLELAKIENMRTQYDDIMAGRKAQTTDDLEKVEQELEAAEELHAIPTKRYGIVAVCAGEGIANLFKELGADTIVTGGQTMNPSTADIIKEINRTPAEIVFVLPNNKNIIMAAEQSIPLCEDKTVVVIPTKTIPQGITAMLNFDPESEVSDIVETLTESLSDVHTAQVTYAARDSDFDGYAIHAGEYLALLDGKLIGSFTEMPAMLNKMSEAFTELEPEIITVYYGEDVSGEDAETTAGTIEKAFPDAEVTVVNGGQPVYYYMISVE
ncbi:MAG: DAK2 domain-containing protein [Clostridiales bacterium]|nr:DAK2 domain-containing protein [Clostridiales bacterium]MDY4144497.1 DAK2 domain-containing protein [Oscillospiraceae bacterium]